MRAIRALLVLPCLASLLVLHSLVSAQVGGFFLEVFTSANCAAEPVRILQPLCKHVSGGNITQLFYWNGTAYTLLTTGGSGLADANYTLFTCVAGSCTPNNDTVTNAALRNSAATSVIGRSAGTTGDPGDIAASADGQVLRRAGGVLGFGADLPQASVTGLTTALDDRQLDITFQDEGAGTGAAGSATTVNFTGAGVAASQAGSTLTVTIAGGGGGGAPSGPAGGALSGTYPDPGLASDAVGTANIANNAVTLAKLPDIATATLLGRTTSGTGDPEVIPLTGGNIIWSGTFLYANVGEVSRTTDCSGHTQINHVCQDVDTGQMCAGDGTTCRLLTRVRYQSDCSAVVAQGEWCVDTDDNRLFLGNGTSALLMTGASGAAGGVLAGTYPNPSFAANGVTNTVLRDSVGTSVIGRSAVSTGDPGDIAASADGQVLRRAGGVLGFGADIPQASIASLSSDLDARQADIQFQDEGTNTGGAGANTTVNFVGPGVSAASSSGTLTVTISTGSATLADGDYNDVTVSGTGTNIQIDPGVIGNAELRDGAATSVIGRSANSTGDPGDIAAAADGEVLRRDAGVLGFGSIPIASVTSLQAGLDGKNSSVQFQDEGTNLGAAGNVDTINVTGAGVVASRTGNAVTINVTAGGGGGETNTASNIGNAGVGVFEVKSGVDLQFRNIAPGSARITVAEDSNNNILVDTPAVTLDAAYDNSRIVDGAIDPTTAVELGGTVNRVQIYSNAGGSFIVQPGSSDDSLGSGITRRTLDSGGNVIAQMSGSVRAQCLYGASPCLAVSAGRIYHDSNGNATLDAGERFIDMAPVEYCWSANDGVQAANTPGYFYASCAETTTGVVTVRGLGQRTPYITTRAARYTRFRCALGTAVPAATTYTYTLLVNGTASALSCQITTGGTSCEDTDTAVVVAADQLLEVEQQDTTATDSSVAMRCTLRGNADD